MKYVLTCESGEFMYMAIRTEVTVIMENDIVDESAISL